VKVMSHLVRSIVLSMVLCALPTSAMADAFYDAYQRGLAAFKTKEYTDARSEFLRAYDLRPEPIILFNVAQTYRLELSSENAIVYYRRFLNESQIAEDLRGEAQAYVAELEAGLRAREEQMRQIAIAKARQHGGVRQDLRASGPPAAAEASLPPSQTRTYIAIAGGAVGVATVGVGLLFGAKARSTVDRAKALCGEQLVCDSANYNEGKRLIRDARASSTTSMVLLVAGGAAIVAGAVVFLTAPRDRDSTAARLVPVINDRGASLAVLGRF